MNKKIVIIRCKALLPSEKLLSLEEKLRKDYETGFMFIPCYCEVLIADGVKTEIVGRERRPYGEWTIVDDVYYECPFCKNREVKFSKHCPECGARLKGGAECD